MKFNKLLLIPTTLIATTSIVAMTSCNHDKETKKDQYLLSASYRISLEGSDKIDLNINLYDTICKSSATTVRVTSPIHIDTYTTILSPINPVVSLTYSANASFTDFTFIDQNLQIDLHDTTTGKSQTYKFYFYLKTNSIKSQVVEKKLTLRD